MPRLVAAILAGAVLAATTASVLGPGGAHGDHAVDGEKGTPPAAASDGKAVGGPSATSKKGAAKEPVPVVLETMGSSAADKLTLSMGAPAEDHTIRDAASAAPAAADKPKSVAGAATDGIVSQTWGERGESHANFQGFSEKERVDSADADRPQYLAARSDCTTADEIARSKMWMMAVVTSPDHFEARQAIRDSYLQVANDPALTVPLSFFIGNIDADKVGQDRKTQMELRIKKESNVVRLDMAEDYHNLNKKAFGIFKYAHQMCYAGVLKVDDDVYADVAQLNAVFKRLMSSGDIANTYGGSRMESAPVGKDPQGKWYAYDVYPHDEWPLYMDGPGFFLGSNLLQFIVNQQDEATGSGCLLGNRIDDAAVGVCLASYKAVNLQDIKMDAYAYSLHRASGGLITYPLTASELPALHKLRISGQDQQGLTPAACVPPASTACLCGHSPHFSGEEVDACWKKVVTSGYVDVIPRSG